MKKELLAVVKSVSRSSETESKLTQLHYDLANIDTRWCVGAHHPKRIVELVIRLTSLIKIIGRDPIKHVKWRAMAIRHAEVRLDSNLVSVDNPRRWLTTMLVTDDAKALRTKLPDPWYCSGRAPWVFRDDWIFRAADFARNGNARSVNLKSGKTVEAWESHLNGALQQATHDLRYGQDW